MNTTKNTLCDTCEELVGEEMTYWRNSRQESRQKTSRSFWTLVVFMVAAVLAYWYQFGQSMGGMVAGILLGSLISVISRDFARQGRGSDRDEALGRLVDEKALCAACSPPSSRARVSSDQALPFF